MPRIPRTFFAAAVIAQAAGGLWAPATSAAGAQNSPLAGKPVPPPLNYQMSLYYERHPSEMAALIARLPIPGGARARAETASPAAPAVGGTWTELANGFPGQGASAPHLMLDGTLLVHDYCTPNWYKLTPDSTGGYANGTWSSIANMPGSYSPLYFASQVLADGRLIVNGGEYEGADCKEKHTNLGAIYDPANGAWTSVPAPNGWTEIGDASSIVLFDETYMLGDCCKKAEALLDPSTMTWTKTGFDKADDNNEEGWALLPKGNVITADAYVASQICGRGIEKYNAHTGDWTSIGNSPVRLSDCSGSQKSYEVGPELLRPSGTVVMFSGETSGVAGTAIYENATGQFQKGPNIPAIGGSNYTLADAPAALEPNGRILFAASPGVPLFTQPTHFFEFTATDAIEQISNDPPNAPIEGSYVFNLLVLPTGQILETDETNSVMLYNPVGQPKAKWAPVITSVPKTIARGQTYVVAGTQLNGLSEAGAYGDDNQSATNYPLIRVANAATGHVFYCRTTGQSSRDIAPGVATTATFIAPARVETGASSLSLVTNGISSAAVSVTIQ